MTTDQTYWSGVASRYHRVGLPFAPDRAVVAQMDAIADCRSGEGLVLGSTPAYANFPLPLTACDVHDKVLAALWPSDKPGLAAVQADWTNMPFADRRFLRIYGDGSLNALPTIELAGRVLDECRRVLGPGGVMLVRCFVAARSSLAFSDLVRSPPKGLSLGNLRMRLFTQMAAEPDYEVSPSGLLAALEDEYGDISGFLEAAGLDPAETGLFEISRGSVLQYVFPPRAVFTALARERGFRADFVETTGYEASELCPVLRLVLPA